MQKHQFEAFGSLKTCLKCFHLETDDIHNFVSDIRVVTVEISSDGNHPGQADNLAVQADPDLKGFDIFKPIPPDIDPGPVEGENDLITETVSAPPASTPLCGGHECPDCKKDWFHDYACESVAKGLCAVCAQQTAVIINRPVEIEQLAQLQSQNISGQDRAEIITTHTSVVYNMIRDDKGEIRPDWQELVHIHIRDLEQIIEKCRIKVLNTRKMMTDELAKEMVKLSPEERAQYLRDAAKQKREPKEPKEPKKIDEKAAYQKMMKDLMTGIKVRATKAGKSFSDEDIQRIAEKQLKLQQDMEGSL